MMNHHLSDDMARLVLLYTATQSQFSFIFLEFFFRNVLQSTLVRLGSFLVCTASRIMHQFNRIWPEDT